MGKHYGLKNHTRKVGVSGDWKNTPGCDIYSVMHRYGWAMTDDIVSACYCDAYHFDINGYLRVVDNQEVTLMERDVKEAKEAMEKCEQELTQVIMNIASDKEVDPREEPLREKFYGDAVATYERALVAQTVARSLLQAPNEPRPNEKEEAKEWTFVGFRGETNFDHFPVWRGTVCIKCEYRQHESCLETDQKYFCPLFFMN